MKVYHRYQMDFNGKWMKGSLLGVAFAVILLAAYYLCWPGLQGVGVAEILFSMALPMIIATAYIVLARLMRLNAPGVYAIIGAALCVVLIISLLDMGLVRLVLGILCYILGGAALLACAGGFLPGRLPVSLIFSAAFAVRLVLDLLNFRATHWLAEGAILAILLSLICMPRAFKAVNE